MKNDSLSSWPWRRRRSTHSENANIIGNSTFPQNNLIKITNIDNIYNNIIIILLCLMFKHIILITDTSYKTIIVLFLKSKDILYIDLIDCIY
jgi:hypothetical protein